MELERLPFDAGTSFFDVGLFNVREFGSIYVVEDDRLAVVETGTSHSAERILQALREADIAPGDVDFLLVSHIHLDHAGGAGYLIRELPNAKVVVHESGARHLADPTRLVASAKEALKDAFAYYGEMAPIPRDRIVPVNEGDTVDLGGRVLRILHCPGHAPHELCMHDEKSGAVYTGDAAGLYFPREDVLEPITPVPSFHLGEVIESLERVMALKPRAFLFSHFGPLERPEERIGELIENHRRWGAFVEARMDAMAPEAIARELYETEGKDIQSQTEDFMLEKMTTSVRGYIHYFRRIRDGGG
jgi:glyoxylase-like metal-dependent hydrolase (beta-lactamase superfamily II)